MLKTYLLVSFSLLILFFSGEKENYDIQKKIIRSNGYDIECYVTLKKEKKYDIGKMYYWFKSGEIHNSISNAGGLLLHSNFSKFYRSNQLIEKGQFYYGLKNGIWKTWHENGQLKELIEWNKGIKSGQFITYDEIGNTIEKGKYRSNNKSGTWINAKTKDTITYKKGALIIKEEKESYFKRLFKKKDSTSSQQNTSKKEDKEGFFKRLFKKKDDRKNSRIKQNNPPTKQNFFKRLFKKNSNSQ